MTKDKAVIFTGKGELPALNLLTS